MTDRADAAHAASLRVDEQHRVIAQRAVLREPPACRPEVGAVCQDLVVALSRSEQRLICFRASCEDCGTVACFPLDGWQWLGKLVPARRQRQSIRIIDHCSSFTYP